MNMSKGLEAFKIIEKEIMYSVKDGRDLVDVGMYFEQLIIVKEELNRIEMLEKRNQPVKLLKEKKYLHDEWYVMFGKCPRCNHYNMFTANYCSNCGQALERIDKGEHHE